MNGIQGAPPAFAVYSTSWRRKTTTAVLPLWTFSSLAVARRRSSNVRKADFKPFPICSSSLLSVAGGPSPGRPPVSLTCQLHTESTHWCLSISVYELYVLQQYDTKQLLFSIMGNKTNKTNHSSHSSQQAPHYCFQFIVGTTS